jgi:valyl-tRNA synthetase
VPYTIKGSNLYLSEERFEGYQNFMNKIWNSARFVFMNTGDLTARDFKNGLDPEALEIEDRWILGELTQLIEKTNSALTEYEFDQYVHNLYHFAWGEYCDWYLELVKGRLYSKDEAMAASRRNAQIVLITVLEGLCRLMHPAASFITEEIWQLIRANYGEGLAPTDAMGLGESLACDSIMVAPWPRAEVYPVLPAEVLEGMRQVMDTISAVRKIRSEMGVPPSQSVDVTLTSDQPAVLDFLRAQEHHLRALARIGELACQDRPDPRGLRFHRRSRTGHDPRGPARRTDRSRAQASGQRTRETRKSPRRRTQEDGQSRICRQGARHVVAAERERLSRLENESEVLRAKLAQLNA